MTRKLDWKWIGIGVVIMVVLNIVVGLILGALLLATGAMVLPLMHGDPRKGPEQACDQHLQHGAGTIPGAPAIYRKQGMPPAASNAEVE